MLGQASNGSYGGSFGDIGNLVPRPRVPVHPAHKLEKAFPRTRGINGVSMEVLFVDQPKNVGGARRDQMSSPRHASKLFESVR